MKLARNISFGNRLVMLGAFAILVTAWNAALSSRRRNESGRPVKAVRQDVQLTVRCPIKIEPRVQVTLRSLVKGRKKSMLVNVGDSVQEGQLLMEISGDEIRKELNQKQINYDNAVSDSLKAQKDLQLTHTLFRKGAASSSEVDDGKRTLVRANQYLNTAKEELETAKKKAPGVRVVSPISGTILKINVDKAEDINERDELLTVAKLDDFVVRGRVDELSIADVKVGQDAAVTCDAFRNTEMPGRVSWIGPQAVEGVFSEVEVLIEITNMQGLQLKSNLSGVARITVGRMNNVIVIPADAMHRGPDGPYVLKENPGGWLSMRNVKLARVVDKSAVITSGLEENDSVLVSGAP